MKNFGPVSCGFLSLLGKFKMPELGFLDQQKMPSWRKLTFFLLLQYEYKIRIMFITIQKITIWIIFGEPDGPILCGQTSPKFIPATVPSFLKKKNVMLKRTILILCEKYCWVRFGVNFSDLQHWLHFFNGSVYSTYVSWFRAHF